MRAVIYARVSTEDQVQNYSLGTQQKACEAYCSARDIDVSRTFREEGDSLETRVQAWITRSGVQLAFEKKISLKDGVLMVDGLPVHENYDACILAVPIHSLACEATEQLEKVELSIYYFQIKDKLTVAFPAYYILAHGSSVSE